MELRDLPAKYDPKGGSPRTPSGGIPLRTYEEYVGNYNGNGTVWKVATSLLAGLFISMTVAYFTALQGKGTSHTEVENYVREFFKDKEVLIAQQNAQQDKEIGKLIGSEERIDLWKSTVDVRLTSDEKDITEIRTKIDLIANYLEALKSKR